MNHLPDFTAQGYQLIRELGHNLVGGRITYLAKHINTQETIVIKQFQFATSGSNWSGYKAVQREIEVLQALNHPGIPKYFDSFENSTGFCIVQEYKEAEPLARQRSFAPDDIKKIAVSILEILVYLQNRIPPIIHQDIKPENILVDDHLNVYLVDFGFAKIGSSEVAMSSIATGTFGFMAQEQIYNRRLSEATDLYGLGATLICLLTGTKSTAMDTLIDEDGQIAFKHLVPKLSLRFIEWLEKMVQRKQQDRFPNAETALLPLKPLYVIRLPKVQISRSSLEFKANKLGEKLTQVITISNPTPETVLEGNLEVVPHQSDPPHTPDSHAWITFKPAKFESNTSNCRITIDTNKLMADKVYNRQLILKTNCFPENYILNLKIQTAPLPIYTKRFPLNWMLLLLVTSLLSTIGLHYINPINYMDSIFSIVNDIMNQIQNFNFSS